MILGCSDKTELAVASAQGADQRRLDAEGKPDFRSLLFRREWPLFMAFDALSVDGEDIRGLPLLARQRRLRRIMPKRLSRLVPVEHIVGRGVDLFRAACAMDLEGVVGKWTHGRYSSAGRTTSWVKIKNPDYSQMRDRHELFESSRGRRGGALAASVLELA